jgi:DNA-binding response OmpR family regulator
MATVLIVEDDIKTRFLTSKKLKAFYEIEEAENGVEALEILDHKHIDLILTDVQMPKMNGYDLVKSLRTTNHYIPVIMTTVMQDSTNKRRGFDAGIDDYMTKPINYEELIWRITALLRRAHIANEQKIVIGKLTVDATTYSVKRELQTVNMAKKEFELLYKLLSYPGIVFTKNQILDDVWGYDSQSDDTTIKTHINRLRNKFKEYSEFEIITVRGLGYKAEIRG